MADILPFKKKRLSEKFQGRDLCKSGFHKWVPISENRFDVKQGRLVTAYRCSRCGAEKNETK